jgi:hypothetical protein
MADQKYFQDKSRSSLFFYRISFKKSRKGDTRMIEQTRIDTIKTNVDLKAYIEQVTSSAFKKNGKGYLSGIKKNVSTHTFRQYGE